MSEESTTPGKHDDSEWSVIRFAEELRELKLRAGAPSLSNIRKRIPTKRQPAISTIAALFAGSGTRAPNLDLVSDVVAATVAYARERDLEMHERLTDMGEWRRRHELVTRAIEQAKTDEDVRRETLLAQFSVLPARQIQRLPFHTLGELVAHWIGRPMPAGGAYLPRTDFDEELRAVLAVPSAPHPFLLVYGDNGAGKSTSAWTAAVETLGPDTKVLIPRDGLAVAALAKSADASTLLTGPVLIWADGLTASDLDHLTRETLEMLANTAFIVATISTNECAAILESPRDQMPTARAALERAYRIHLSYDPEIFEIIDEATGPKRVEPGLNEPSADPNLLWLRLHTAHSRGEPGAAVVRCVIDWRRVGLARPMLEDELKQLFPIYLAEIGGVTASDELFAAAKAWAQNPGPGAPAMLHSRHHRGHLSWAVSGQLWVDKTTWKIPDALWPTLINMLDPRECFHIAREAEILGELIYATKALSKAATVPENTARANVLLGSLFRSLGDLPAAKTALMTVIRLGSSEETSAAAHLLGSIFEKEGDTGSAIEYWTLATEWPGTFALMSWLELGRHYASVGDKERAVTALNRDFSGAIPGLELRASTLLSFVQGSIDDLRAILEAWETGSDYRWANHEHAVSALRDYLKLAQSPNNSEHSAGETADLTDIDAKLADSRRRFELGDLRGALKGFRSLAASGSPDLRAAALFGAGSAAQEMGLAAEAKEAYEESIRCDRPDYSAQAALSLGALSWEENDAPGAIRAWTSAMRLGDSETQAKAAFNIGIAHHNAREYTIAVSRFQHALELARSGFKAKIAMMLAETHQAMKAEASIVDEYYLQALNIGDPHYSPMAAVKLGSRTYHREGPSADALRLTRLGCESEESETRSEAAWRLGHMLEERGELDEAIAAYKTTIDTGHTDWAPAGHCALGLLHGTQNRTNIGLRHLRAAYDSGHAEYRVEAAYWIGMFYWWDGTHGKEGALQNAVIMLQHAVDSGNTEWASRATTALDSIREYLGDL